MQPNAPGTQGYNRYAYAANNPARWTDPSGHSVSDAGALQAPIRVFVEQMQTLGALTLALMPVMLALGPFGGLLGLALAMQFLMLAMLIFMVIAQMLDIMQDPFSYYDGDAPTEHGPEWTSEELEDAGNGHPETPDEECPFGEQPMSEQEFVEHYTRSMFGGPAVTGCSTRLPNYHDLVTLIDLAALVLSLASLVVMGVFVLAGCAGGLLGCVYGGIAGAIATRMILTLATLLGLASAIVACAGGAYDDRSITSDCVKGSAGAILGLYSPAPALGTLIDAAVLWCFDLKDEGRACRFVNGAFE